MKPVLVYASQAGSGEELEQKYGKYCITKSSRFADVVPLAKYSNTEPLAKVYNTFINSGEYITVLAHDDVLIRDPQWIEKVEQGLEKYDVVGVAGGSEAVIEHPCLWHIMCPRQTHRGRVSHVNSAKNGTFVTHFGLPGRVLILDGLFLAFKTKKLHEAGVKFDESNPSGFHFYDIDFSLTCNSKGLKLGTVDIDIIHNSPGLKSFTDDWLSAEVWFQDKVKNGKYSV